MLEHSFSYRQIIDESPIVTVQILQLKNRTVFKDDAVPARHRFVIDDNFISFRPAEEDLPLIERKDSGAHGPGNGHKPGVRHSCSKSLWRSILGCSKIGK